jgi:aspartyl-tRNA(Asn)/glutamyl-tRNA(Gln) amidotransferase subunit A
MSAQELVYLTLREAADRVRLRQVSPVELLDAVLTRTSALEPQINAYITPLFDQARAAARQAEQEITAGQYRGPLHGIPIALKDNYWTQGVKTTAGSKFLADFVPAEDGTVVAKLRAAGAVITGKCNMHELAL